MPIFNIKPRISNNEIYFDISLNDNIARDVKFNFDFLHGIEVGTVEEKLLSHQLLPGKADFDVCWFVKNQPVLETLLEVNVSISFQDLNGNRYQQRILISGTDVYLTLPIEKQYNK